MPWWHLAKIVQNIYDVTGVKEGRSVKHSAERYFEQFNNNTNKFTFDLLWKEVGYNQNYGFPKDGVSSSVRYAFQVFLGPEERKLLMRVSHDTKVCHATWTAKVAHFLSSPKAGICHGG